MNATAAEAVKLASAVAQQLGRNEQIDIAVCPPFVYLAQVAQAIKGSRIDLGAQNCFFENNGAFTGEISAAMLKDVGCRYVILGHSERRHIIGETDELINRKVLKALSDSLEVILAVGELLAERDAGATFDVVSRQVKRGLEGVLSGQMISVTIAYEPVWAIGTGRTATPQQAQDVHAKIRQLLGQLYDEDIADAVRIQYGGSVKATNAKELLACPDIDGALVGGASLKAEEFAGIVQGGMR
jgi:triosephosphate isomerase (TIM)